MEYPIEILCRRNVDWFQFCSPCEVPYHTYRSIESSGQRSRTFVRMFDVPMNERCSRGVVRQNHEPKGRWTIMARCADHSEQTYFQRY